MRYFFLKMGPGNAYAAPMIRGTLGGGPAVVGFLRGRTLEELREYHTDKIGRSPGQVHALYRWAIGETPGYAVTVAEGRLWVLAVSGPVYEYERERFTAVIGEPPHEEDTVLAVPVSIEVEERLSEVPTMIAQINANRRLSSSSFKEIEGEYGTLAAIDHVLFRAGICGRYPHIDEGEKNIDNLLRCLSHNEHIELVARAIESLGLHVSAPTGGFVKNIDLFVRNDHTHTVERGPFQVPGRSAFRPGTIGLQIRTPSARSDEDAADAVDFAIVPGRIEADDERDPRVLDLDWLIEILAEAPAAIAWFERVVRWVPYAGTLLRRVAHESSDGSTALRLVHVPDRNEP